MLVDTSDIIIALFSLVTPGISGLLFMHYSGVLKHRDGKAFRRLRASLRKGSSTAVVYAWTLRRLLEATDRFFEGPPYEQDDDREKLSGRLARQVFRRPANYLRPGEIRTSAWQARPWSAASYERCLLLAIIYPVLFAIVSWFAVGEAGDFGQALGLAPSAETQFRLFAAVTSLSIMFLVILFVRDETWVQWVFLTSALLILIFAPKMAGSIFPNIDVTMLGIILHFALAFAFAFAVAGAVAGAIAGAFAIAIAFAFAFAFALAFAFAGAVAVAVSVAVAVAFAFAFAFAGAVAVAGAASMQRQALSLLALSVFYLAAAVLLVMILSSSESGSATFGVLIGLTILPLINAPFDWLSIGLTRYLLRLGLQRQRLRDRLACWFADLGGAILLLLGLAVSMVVVLEGLNAIGFANGMRVPVAPVETLLHDIRAEPDAGRHLWIYFALFSTLIPTLVHVAVMIASALTANLPPMQGRALRLIATKDQGYNTQSAFLLSARWLVAIPATALFGYAVYLVGSQVSGVWEKLLWLLIEVQKASAAFFAT